MHHAQCLAVALGFRLAKIEGDSLLGISAFLLSNDRHLPAAVPGKPRDHRRVIAVSPVPMQFVEILEEQADVIHQIRPLGMARQKSTLPGAHVLVKLCAQLRDFSAKAIEILGGNLGPREALQVIDFALKFFDLGFSGIFFHDIWWHRRLAGATGYPRASSCTAFSPHSLQTSRTSS